MRAHLQEDGFIYSYVMVLPHASIQTVYYLLNCLYRRM